jgi:nucleoside-diphosphate-sugar epimerase
MKNPTILLLGGGYTLERVAKLLPADSFVITSRSKERCDAWQAKGWLSYPISLKDDTAVVNLFKSYPTIKVLVDSVPPLASSASIDAASAPEGGISRVIKALPGSATERIIYLSTTGVFGVRDGSWVDESSLPNPWNPLALARFKCEELYRLAAKELCVSLNRRVSSTALRLPAIYGFDRGVLHSLRAGTYSLVGDGSQWTNRIHVDDLALIIKGLIEYNGELPPVVCINDDTPTQAYQVVAYLCDRFKLAQPPSVSPEEVARRGAYTMLSNQRVSNKLIKQILGITLRYPSFREAVEVQGGGRISSRG